MSSQTPRMVHQIGKALLAMPILLLMTTNPAYSQAPDADECSDSPINVQINPGVRVPVSTYGGFSHTEYWFTWQNVNSFPPQLFERVEGQPLCKGFTGGPPSRTCVSLRAATVPSLRHSAYYRQTDHALIFSVGRGDELPDQVYFELEDRKCGNTYTSNTVALSQAKAWRPRVSPVRIAEFLWGGNSPGVAALSFLLYILLPAVVLGVIGLIIKFARRKLRK